MSEAKALAQTVFHKMMEKDFCSRWMGITPLEIDEGFCRIKMTVKVSVMKTF